MAKCWSATSVVALALLGCLVVTEVEAQDTGLWKKPAPPPLPPWQIPQNPQPPPYPPGPQPKPQDPQLPPYPPPKPPRPQDPQFPPYPPPKPRPQDPQFPPYPPPKPRPQDPQFPPYPPPKPPRPQDPQFPPYPPPKPRPQDPQLPPYQPPPQPTPQDPQLPPYPPPKPPRPQDPQFPPYPPPHPPRPQDPQLPPYQPPPKPRPQDPQHPPYQPPPKPRPQDPQLPPYPPPKPPRPQDPQFPPYPPRPQDPQFPPVPRPQLPKPQDPQLPPYRPPQLPRPQDPQPPPRPLPPLPQTANDPKLPKFPQNPKVPPVGPGVNTCEVERSLRVPCGGSQVGSSAAACEAINCCFDGQQCYFGKTVTVQCTRDAQFIVVVARDVTLPNLDLQTISLLGGGQGCTNVDSNSAFAIYQFPVTACGTIFMEEPGVIVYENRMTSSYEVAVGPSGSITRDSHYDLVFQCRYIGTSTETLIVEIFPLGNPPLPVSAVGPIKVIMRLANGQCFTKGCHESDVVYNSFYTDADYPVTKVLRDPVYVEVQLLEKTDPMLVLTLGRCWVTTSPYPHTFPQWDILVDGCPYRDDNYLSSLVPVGPNSGLQFPSHYRRFFFKMFTFVGSPVKTPTVKESMNEKLYLHCSTAVCVNGQFVSCEPVCTRRKRAVEAADQERIEPKTVVSSGPLIMTAPE
ncbi:zona pellucida sperm-binding protein 1-like [Archocentrus centrarchus]|uniref:zona pellucida sperm-binding protein 1-like n=1 Tax=Archocentrus centrarchus TaxID=63155 RepID=UPI0011EA12E5|nr:zona pellucida sperm-binding protein 1-like [Archocentrus centrarchus]